jgi:hypothetical protein
VIVDPCLGYHWLRVSDRLHPAGPARLIQFDSNLNPASDSQASSSTARLNIIRAGDRITVEQNRPQLVAHLQAVALEPAAAGETFRAKLNLGKDGQIFATGPVVHVLATKPGLARWTSREWSGQ